MFELKLRIKDNSDVKLEMKTLFSEMTDSTMLLKLPSVKAESVASNIVSAHS